MPLKITNISSDSEIVLDKIEFKEEKNVKYFQVSNSNGIGVNFEYIPNSTSNWDKERMEIHLFENPYFTAENDVFEIYEKSGKDRLGWIFPITILESNDNDFADHKNLNNYKFVAYQKLLELNYSISSQNSSKDFIKLSSVFGNIIICLLHKDAIQNIKDFEFNRYILSFHKNGYLVHFGSPKSKTIYNRTSFIDEKRKERRITIEPSNFEIVKNNFTKSLFIEHLLQSDNYLVRFIFLYQIIEHFVNELSEKQFYQHIENYIDNKSTKNDFRENISKSSTERELVSDIFSLTIIPHELQQEFNTEIDFFFNDIGKVYKKNSFSDKIYNLRNIVTHNVRELTTKSDDLKKITEIFERIIIELLINLKNK